VRWHSRFGWLTVVALAVAIGGIAVGISAYGPSTATIGGIDAAEYVTRDFYYRLWTIVGSVAIAAVLLVVDAF
jgi:hypothetical protein